MARRHQHLVREDSCCPSPGCGGVLLYTGRSKATYGCSAELVPLCCYYRCERCQRTHKREVIYRRIDRRRDASNR